MMAEKKTQAKAQATPKEEPKQKAQTITVGQAAALLGRSERWVTDLVQKGFIAKEARGQYSLVAVVRGAVAYYEDLIEKSNKSAAASRATDARTREIELRIAERRRELISVEDAKAVVLEFGAIVRAEFNALPARYTRDMTERRKLEQEVDGSFERIAAAARRAEAALADPDRAMPAEPEA
jgi:phage terminase Nu1 subunit (DNA packaging protein)